MPGGTKRVRVKFLFLHVPAWPPPRVFSPGVFGMKVAALNGVKAKIRCLADPAGRYPLRGNAGSHAFGFLGAFGRINNLLFPSDQSHSPAPSDDSAGSEAIRCRRGIGPHGMIFFLSGAKAGDEGCTRAAGTAGRPGFPLPPLAPPG